MERDKESTRAKASGSYFKPIGAGGEGRASRYAGFTDDLITKAREGITPEQAEAQAKAAGLPPLASRPDLAIRSMSKAAGDNPGDCLVAWRDMQLVAERNPDSAADGHWYRANGMVRSKRRTTQNQARFGDRCLSTTLTLQLHDDMLRLEINCLHPRA